ncbi:thioredoxin family protein [Bacillus sp. B1-b2]|uniref:thioredoxin family protein n=1 Tax=Bacillus sp. B1-b2 TaxID=2653201 RepID=UPI001261B605|nr:thioredoxin family protein [Bacillus sp. B1-b2]KAB7666507.1 thioredoxin family protein [Bacillus sp. B1-b2]
MMEWKLEQWREEVEKAESVFLYLYTPLCGTCMVASKMLTIITAMKPELKFGKMDMNYAKDLARQYQIESVPCLLVINNKEVKEKVYRFESVPHLLTICQSHTSL